MKYRLIHWNIKLDAQPHSFSSECFPASHERSANAKSSTAHAGMFENFLVRKVYSDKAITQRNIVVETVGSSKRKGKRLAYNSQAAVITLDKQNKK